ncbi:unnamed protein product [Fusarium fujikuroi]|nr:unnamed protein product [Fusarium fujikuroi]
MADDEATSAPPMQSSPPSSFIFPSESSHEDGVSAKKPPHRKAATTIISSDIQSEDETSGPRAAMPTDKSIPAISQRLEHRTKMDLVLAWVKNVQYPEDLMSEGVVSESLPVSIDFEQLLPATRLLYELHKALGHEPIRISDKSSTTTVCISEEYISAKEQRIVELFTEDVNVIGMSSLKGATNRFGSHQACLIHGIIFGEVGLLRMMRNLRAYCQASEHVQSLPITFRYSAATIIVVLLPESDLCTSLNRQVQDNRNWRRASVQQEAYNFWQGDLTGARQKTSQRLIN